MSGPRFLRAVHRQLHDSEGRFEYHARMNQSEEMMNKDIETVANSLPPERREAFLQRVGELLRSHPDKPSPWQIELAIRVALHGEASAA